MKHFRKGGIHPNSNKLTAGDRICDVSSPEVAAVSLIQSIGAPSKCVVKPGQLVERGEIIAEPGGFVSAAVHSPIAGVVKKVEPIRDPQGIWRPGVIIEAPNETVSEVQTGSQSAAQSEATTLEIGRNEGRDEILKIITPEEIVNRVKSAGIVGAGGATFPTHVKLSIPEGKRVEYVILNGAECEPYLTCDDALMREEATEILSGMQLIMKAVGAKYGIVGIESNKPEAIEAMRSVAREFNNIEVQQLRTSYPQGSEKQLIEALVGRKVPSGKLPLDVGVIVDNVATAYCVSRAVYEDEAMTERIVTVTGPHLRSPGNFRVRIGTPITNLIEMAGGIPEDTGKIIAGGPMMGKAVSYPEATTTKGLSGVLVLPKDMSRRGETQPCLRCSRCVDVCPMGLEPYLLMTLGKNSMDDDAKEHGVLNCLECGCCSYVCPSVRPILDYIRLSRQRLRKRK